MTLLSLKTDVNVPTESNKKNKLEKNLFFIGILEATDEKSRVNQVYGSKDPDQDPYQNITGPAHCKYHFECAVIKKFRLRGRGKRCFGGRGGEWSTFVYFCRNHTQERFATSLIGTLAIGAVEQKGYQHQQTYYGQGTAVGYKQKGYMNSKHTMNATCKQQRPETC
jgi:hypothetical protein